MEDEVDFRQYLAVFWRWRSLLVAVTLASVLVAAVFSFVLLAPVYEASSLLLVSEPRLRMPSPSDGLQTRPLPFLTTENLIAMVQNDVVAAQVASKLGGSGRDLNELVAAVKLSPVRGTSLVRLQARASTPGSAQAVARAWSEAIVGYVDDMALEETRQTLSVLDQKVEAARRELLLAENALKDFQAATKIPILSQRVQDTVQRIAVYELRLREIEQGGGPVAGEVTLQPTGRSYALSVISMRDPARLRRILAVLRSDLEQNQRTLAVEQQGETQLIRQAELARSTQRLLVQKREEQRILLGANTGIVRVVVPPVAPQSPAAPRPTVNISIAIVLGLLAGTVLVFVAEFFRPTAPPERIGITSPRSVGDPRPADR